MTELSLFPLLSGFVREGTWDCGMTSVRATTARINTAPEAGRSLSRSPITTYDVIQAKTGSSISTGAMCVEGSTDCAQLWTEKATVVLRTARTPGAMNSRGVQET